MVDPDNHHLCTSTPITDDNSGNLERRVQVYLSGSTKDSREDLLLHAIEGSTCKNWVRCGV